MSWAQSLIRISTHEVETLQKRLAEIVERRHDAETRLTRLAAEARAETAHAANNTETGWCHIGFLQGWRLRRDRLIEEIAVVTAEEAGARDALSQAFENQKKFEQVAENARLAAAKEAARKDAAAMDELGQRKAGRR